MAQRWPDIRASQQHRRVKRGKRAARVNNATVAKHETEASPGPVVHCVVCLNRGNYSADPRGVTVVKGYAACPDHLDLVAQPGFDVFMLRSEQRKSV